MTDRRIWGDGVGDGHPRDLLSAYADDEATPAEVVHVEAHLAGCPDCQASLDALVSARELLRSLPPVHGDRVVARFVDRHRAVLRRAATFVTASGLALLLVGLSATTRNPTVEPDVAALVAMHGAAGEIDVQASMGMATVADVGTNYVAPWDIAEPSSSVSLRRAQVLDGEDLTAVRYDAHRDSGLVPVSVFQQPGHVRWSSLVGGRLVEVAEHRTWIREGSPLVMVTQRGDLAVTVVSDDQEAAVMVLHAIPDRHRRSTLDRAHDVCQRFVEVFSLGG